MNHHVNNVKYVRWMLEVMILTQFPSHLWGWITIIYWCTAYFHLKVISLAPQSDKWQLEWKKKISPWLNLSSLYTIFLQNIPELFLENHQLSSITLEYRRECGSTDMVQSLCEPDEDAIQEDGNDINLLRGFSLTSEIFEGHKLLGPFEKWPFRYTHLLQVKGELKNEEIVRGRTTWKKKPPMLPFPTVT